MTKRSLIFQDQVTLAEKPTLFSDTLNLVDDIFGAGGGQNRVALRTRIRATHSGYLLNSRVYPGVFMEQSVGSWVTPENGGTASYNKPVILNHDQEDVTKVIGRVKGATFTRLQQGNNFLQDYKRPAQGRDHGSGHIIIDTVINDPDAITKILDGRYDTVSTGQKPDAARCNICGFDWATYDPWADSGEPCEHRPGKLYQIDKQEYPCFLVTGKLNFREASYITVPAQPNARTLEANLESLNHFASKDSENQKHIFNSFNDKGSLLGVNLLDAEGHELDLTFRDGEDDVMPDIATRFTKTAIFFPETEDNEMGVKKDQKKTTDTADDILDSWIEDAAKRSDESDDSNDLGKDTIKDKEENKDEIKDKEDVKDIKDSKPKETVKEAQRVSDAALKEVIDTVRSERDSLKDSTSKLENQLSEKTSLVDTLTTQITDLRTQQLTDASRTLAIVRVITGQKKTALKDSEAFNAYVKELSTRSIDSLSDAISDSLPLLQDALKSGGGKAQGIGDVENPTLQHSDTSEDTQGDNDESNKNELIDGADFLNSF